MIERFAQADDWQERQAFFMEQVRSHWVEQPGTALAAWVWRLQRFLGFHGDGLRRPHVGWWGPAFHGAAVASLFALLVVRLRRGMRSPRGRLDPARSLGLVTAALFCGYAAIHALFAYAGFRYVTGALVYLVAAIAFLAAESWLAPSEPG